MRRRENPNQLLINWTARVSGDVSTRKDERPQNLPVPGRQTSPTKRKRYKTPARLPVPDPLPEAVEKEHFGKDPDTDEPVKPGPREVRAITENHAERMIAMLEALTHLERQLSQTVCTDRARLYHEKDKLNGQFQSARMVYAEDFGEPAAARLESYVHHQFERANVGKPRVARGR